MEPPAGAFEVGDASAREGGRKARVGGGGGERVAGNRGCGNHPLLSRVLRLGAREQQDGAELDAADVPQEPLVMRRLLVRLARDEDHRGEALREEGVEDASADAAQRAVERARLAGEVHRDQGLAAPDGVRGSGTAPGDPRARRLGALAERASASVRRPGRVHDDVPTRTSRVAAARTENRDERRDRAQNRKQARRAAARATAGLEIPARAQRRPRHRGLREDRTDGSISAPKLD